MRKRFQLIGWHILSGICIGGSIVLGIVLIPIWGILWGITGRFYPEIAIRWIEDNFPPEVTS
jgi:hypothetical protein